MTHHERRAVLQRVCVDCVQGSKTETGRALAASQGAGDHADRHKVLIWEKLSGSTRSSYSASSPLAIGARCTYAAGEELYIF